MRRGPDRLAKMLNHSSSVAQSRPSDTELNQIKRRKAGSGRRQCRKEIAVKIRKVDRAVVTWVSGRQSGDNLVDASFKKPIVCTPRSPANMASSLRLPAGHSLSTIRSGKGIRPFYPVVAPPCQCRHFSQAPRVNTKAAVAQSIPRQRPAQPSMRSRARTVTRADMPQDLGLLAGTFIRPLWSNMPSIMEQPKERLLMEWLWVKTSFANFVG